MFFEEYVEEIRDIWDSRWLTHTGPKHEELVRRLRERGAEVRVAMTEAAKAFITPLSLQAVSGYPVSDSLLASGYAG